MEEPLGRYLVELEVGNESGRSWYGEPSAAELVEWGPVLLRAGVRAGHSVTTEREDRDRRSGPARREDRFYVYRRHDQPCRRCGTLVRTEVMVGRNLFWCPVCQA